MEKYQGFDDFGGRGVGGGRGVCKGWIVDFGDRDRHDMTGLGTVDICFGCGPTNSLFLQISLDIRPSLRQPNPLPAAIHTISAVPCVDIISSTMVSTPFVSSTMTIIYRSP